MSLTPIDFQSWFYRGREAARAADPRVAVDALVADSPQAVERACAAGCAYCCYFPVGVTSTEASFLAGAIQAELSDASFADLRARVEERAKLCEALSWKGQGEQKMACVLLDAEDRCSAYAARPVACRGWNSRSLRTCEIEFASDTVPEPATDGPAFITCLGAHEELRQRGDGKTYELSSALARALSGDTNFDGCKEHRE